MAKPETWRTIEDYFSVEEFGKSALNGMQDKFLLSLYRFRVAMDNPIIIHYNGGYSIDGHSRKSMHYMGRAIDFHFKYPNVSLRQLIVTALNCGLYGIGAYPYWEPQPGGFHLDNRPPGKFNIWSRNEAGIYTYTFPDKIPESLEEWR